MIIVETDGLFGAGYASVDHDAWTISGYHMNRLSAVTPGGIAQNPTYSGTEVIRATASSYPPTAAIAVNSIVSGRTNRWFNLARGADDEILVAASDSGTYAFSIMLIMADQKIGTP